MAEQEITQTQAINIGAYTIIKGVDAMREAGLTSEFIFDQLEKSAGELRSELPAGIAEVIEKMAVTTVKAKTGL